jgi:Protein of unknown function (DUF3108)
MKNVLPGLLMAMLLLGFTTQQIDRRIPNTSFGPGEHIDYRVHYGFINAAEASIDVAPTIYKVNDRPCFKVNVYGQTVGAFGLVKRVRDTWRSYIDTSAILPQRFYLNIQEGDYRKEENVTFNHLANTAKAEERTERDLFKVPDNVHDIISGYFYLRTIDFNKIAVGQILNIPTFFDDTVFQTKVRYQGRDQIKTRFGKINVLRLNPMGLDAKFFKGEEPMKIWVSDDANKVPVRVEVELAIGSIDMDIKQYGGLKQPLKFYK